MFICFFTTMLKNLKRCTTWQQDGEEKQRLQQLGEEKELLQLREEKQRPHEEDEDDNNSFSFFLFFILILFLINKQLFVLVNIKDRTKLCSVKISLHECAFN